MLVFAPVAALLETTVLIVDPDLANFTSPKVNTSWEGTSIVYVQSFA